MNLSLCSSLDHRLLNNKRRNAQALGGRQTAQHLALGPWGIRLLDRSELLRVSAQSNEHVSIHDLTQKLNQAIDDEDYDSAANLRDDIQYVL